MTLSLQLPTTTVTTDALRARFPVRSKDPNFTTQLATDCSFDATVATGFATGTLPANGGTVGAGGMVNLANDNPPALPVAVKGAVTVAANSAAIAYVDTGAGARGMSWNGEGTANGGKVSKAAIADKAVWHPPTEGFLDFAFIVWVKPTILNYWSLVGCSNQNAGANQYKFWGLACNASAVFSETLSARPIAIAAAVWNQVGVHYRYDVPNNLIYVRTFLNGAEVNTSLAGTAVATTPTALTAGATGDSANAHTKAMIGSNNIDPCLRGIVGRWDRHFTARTGNTLDPAVLVAKNYASGHLAITGA